MPTMTERPKELLAITKMFSELIEAMLDYPQDFLISVHPDTTGYTLNVRVGASDVGKLIGVNGRNAQSLRIILNAISRRSGLTIHLSLDQGPGQQRVERRRRT